jgi:hypothetical protein
MGNLKERCAVLIAKIVVSLGLLYTSFSFLFNQFNYRSPLKKVSFNLLVLIGSIPLIYALYCERMNNKSLMNLDIGIAFNITWIVTLISLLFGITIILVNKR